jgi:uncharacterized tellurite resistance protein B-like protein
MFERLKTFLDELNLADGSEPPAGAPSLRLAAAVLLVEVMRATQGISVDERGAAAPFLAEHFKLGDGEIAALLQQAERESTAAWDYFHFTNPLDEALSQPSKIALIEAMWQVAYADRHADPRENTVISKVADLLHVPHGDYIAAKMRAKPRD